MSTEKSPRRMTNGTATTQKPSALTSVLFAVYAILLVGLIIFKFPFDYGITTIPREVNLLPFVGSTTEEGTFAWGEVIENILAFIPLGLYLGMLKPGWTLWMRFAAIIATTVAFELIQFSFGIGRADITDVLTNAVGGLVGIGLYLGARRALRSRSRAVLTVACLVLTVLVVLFWAYLALHSFVRTR